MADIVAEQGAQAPAASNPSPELHQAMQMALGKDFVPDIPAQMEPQQPQPPAEPAPAQQAPAATPQEPAQPAAPATDIFAPFREKFGYQSPEDALRDIEETKAKLADPFREINFANDESAAMALALSQGKFDVVRDHLNKQDRLQSLASMEVTKDTAADIVKYGMQLQYPFLTQDEINYEFNKQFAISPKPIQAMDEDAADYDARVAQWSEQANDKYMGLVIQAKKLKPELDKAKKDLVFPKIEQPMDQGYVQYRQMLEQEAKMQQEAEQAYKSFTPKHLETKIRFTDEPNKIDFEFQHVPDEKAFVKAVEIANDDQKFWNLFKNSDGSWNHLKMLDVIDYAMNKEGRYLEAMKQAKNAAIKANLPDNSQQSGMIRQMPSLPSGEGNELDQQMKRALGQYYAANQ